MSTKTKQLLKQNNLREEQLTKENQNIMTDIVCYLRSFPISTFTQEKIRSDVMEMLLDGQQRNLTATQVLGDDYEAFCKEVIDESPKLETKEKILTGIGHIAYYTTILLVITFAISMVDLLDAKNLYPNIEIHANFFVQLAIIIPLAVIIVNYICKTSFQQEKPIKKRAIYIYGTLSILIILLSSLLKQYTFTINLYVYLAITLILFIIYKVIDEIYE